MAWNAPLKKHSFRSAKAYSRPLSGSQRQPRMSKTNKAFTRHHDASDKHLTKRQFGRNQTRYSGSPAVVGWCTPCILWGCGDCYFWLLTLDHRAPPHPAGSLPKEGQEKEEDREDLSASENWTVLDIQWMKDLYCHSTTVWSTWSKWSKMPMLPAQR